MQRPVLLSELFVVFKKLFSGFVLTQMLSWCQQLKKKKKKSTKFSAPKSEEQTPKASNETRRRAAQWGQRSEFTSRSDKNRGPRWGRWTPNLEEGNIKEKRSIFTHGLWLHLKNYISYAQSMRCGWPSATTMLNLSSVSVKFNDL